MLTPQLVTAASPTTERRAYTGTDSPGASRSYVAFVRETLCPSAPQDGTYTW